MALRQKNGLYYMYYRLHGKLRTRSLHTYDLADAKLREKAIMQQIRNRRFVKSFADILPMPIISQIAGADDFPGRRAADNDVLSVLENKSHFFSVCFMDRC